MHACGRCLAGSTDRSGRTVLENDTTPAPPSPLFGRGDLLASVERRLAAGGGVVLTGPDGIGKSTILDALAGSAADRDELVVRLNPAETEQWLPDAGLADLLEQLPPGALTALPAPQRVAIEAVLLRADAADADESRTPLARRLAVRAVLDRCARQRPVLLVLDDAQWLDAGSADVLAYVMRRVIGRRIRVLAAERSPSPGSRPGAVRLCPAPTLELPVPPLGAADVVDLLEASGLPVRTASRLYADSGGNPFLALALGGAFVDRHGSGWRPAPLPDRVRARLGTVLRGLPATVTDTLLVAALAARPTVADLRLAGRADAAREVEYAAAAGLVAVDGGVVRFTPPAVAVVLAAEVGANRRTAVHATLARTARDPVEAIRHQAMTSDRVDADIARSLVVAAESARRRGALGLVAELYLLAAERTPPDLNDERSGWLVAAAEAAAAGGQPEVAGRAVEAVLGAPGPAAHRVRARMALVDASGQALAELDELLAAALSDAAADPALLAPLRLRMAWQAMVVGRPDRAAQQADEAVRQARQVQDTTTEAMALTVRAQVERLAGTPTYARTLASARALPALPSAGRLHLTPGYLAVRLAIVDDRLDDARADLLSMLAVVERGSGGEELVGVLRSLAEVAARSGRCREALRYAGRAIRVGQVARLSPGPGWYTAAVAELAGGSLPRAAGYARHGVRVSREEGDSIYLRRNLHALGQAMLRDGDARGAVQALSELRTLDLTQGVADPAALRWHADLAAGLAALGARAEADRVLADARRDAVLLGGSAGVLGQLDRVAAVILAEQGDAAAAVELAAAAADRFAGLRQPIEQGHCLLVQGGAERRRRRYAAARLAIGAALAVFLRAEATPWVEQATRLLAPDGGGASSEPAPRSPVGDTLTSTEARIAALVRRGQSNREIAGRLFVSVKTVEASLTRIYRKLGVRSRTQLSSRLAATPEVRSGVAARGFPDSSITDDL